VSVAGAVEIPFALQVLAKTGNYDCLVALGCVIRGETPHFDYVCNMAQQGALQVSLNHNVPVGFGVLTLNGEAQARARRHVGAEAVAAALELARLARSSR
jgi:6,7-dimethyl-8-ribityllumazine synthase